MRREHTIALMYLIVLGIAVTSGTICAGYLIKAGIFSTLDQDWQYIVTSGIVSLSAFVYVADSVRRYKQELMRQARDNKFDNPEKYR